MNKLKQYITAFIGWPLSIISIYFIAKTFLPGSNDIIRNLNNNNIPVLLTGIICFTGYYFIRSIIWHIIVRNLGYEISFRKSAFLWEQSEFKRYIPGNIWSFVGKSVAFAQFGITKRHLAKAMLVEMQLIFLGSVFVAALSIPFVKKILPGFSLNSYPEQLSLIAIFAIVFFYIYQNKLIKVFKGKIHLILNYILPGFIPEENFKLLLLSSLALLLFGLGYYFCISSVFFLIPESILALSGFFVFSLLIGLLSFITPTGLGIREGIIVIGLSHILSIPQAGFASFFGRVMLIITEIFFLLISYIYYKLNIGLVNRAEKFISKYIYETILATGIIIFCFYILITAFLKYDNFYMGRFDLGNMAQTVWNTNHGRIFQLTNPDGVENISRLAVHADFILILISPFYLLWQDPRMLLVIQTLIVGSGAIFVYYIALRLLNNKLISISFAFSYLLNPGIMWSSLYDFHGVTLATTFLLGAYYFLIKGKYKIFLVMCILAAITKEHIWVITALLGLYIFMRELILLIKRNKKQYFNKKIIYGISCFIGSVAIFSLLIFVFIPRVTPQQKHFALSYFNENNDNEEILIKSILFNPAASIAKITAPDRLFYIKELLIPLGYLPLLSVWYLLFPSADLVINLLSDKNELHQIYYQYTAAISPFLFIAAIYSVRFILKIQTKISPFVVFSFILVAALYGSYLFGPLPWSERPNTAMYSKQNNLKNYIISKLNSLPENAKVATSNNLGAHLSHREYIYTLPFGVESADFVTILLPDNPSFKEKQLISDLKNNNKYKLIWQKELFYGFKRI